LQINVSSLGMLHQVKVAIRITLWHHDCLIAYLWKCLLCSLDSATRSLWLLRSCISGFKTLHPFVRQSSWLYYETHKMTVHNITKIPRIPFIQ
jgi:hypothetical protein